MLRSIFSLIQNIIDSDKEYNNKKSKTVIYLVSNPDNTLNMDLEIDGKARQKIKSIEDTEKAESSGSFKITTEQGDTVTCKHFTNKKISLKSGCKDAEKLQEEYRETVEKVGERTSFSNNAITDDKEILTDAKKLRDFEGDAEMTVRDLLAKLPQKQMKLLEKDKDHIKVLLDQIKKMKQGMERLQEIAQQFECSSKFKEDIECLMKNVAPALDKSKSKQNNLTPKDS